MVLKKLFRAKTTRKGYWNTDYNNEPTSFQYTGVEIDYSEYEVIRETDKSYLIRVDCYDQWVKKNGTKIFARINRELALNDLLCRKQKQSKILKRQLKECEDSLTLIKSTTK